MPKPSPKPSPPEPKVDAPLNEIAAWLRTIGRNKQVSSGLRQRIYSNVRMTAHITAEEGPRHLLYAPWIFADELEQVFARQVARALTGS